MIYVGRCHDSFMAIFKSATTPTMKSHGHLYRYCIGPFQTLRAAQFMAQYGVGNPHIQTVSDCERIAKLEVMK